MTEEESYKRGGGERVRIRGSAVYDYRCCYIFLGAGCWGRRRGVATEESAGDARDISNFLITLRGANDPLSPSNPLSSLSVSLSPTFVPFSFSLNLSRFLSVSPFRPASFASFYPPSLSLSNASSPHCRYNVASFYPQSPPHGPPLQSHTNQPSEWTPLVFIIKISIGSKPRYIVQYAAGNAGDIHAKSQRRKPKNSLRLSSSSSSAFSQRHSRWLSLTMCENITNEKNAWFLE